jgi:hypothetical protein
MTLRDVIQTDGETVFCNSDDFGETVTYYPRDGRSRSFVAVVFRNPVSMIPEDFDVANPVFEVHVHNDPVTGIDSEQLNRGGDYLAFPDVVGRDVKKHSIRLVDHDEGMLVLECR